MGFAFDSLVRTIVDFSLFTFMGNVFSVLDVLVIICTLGFTIVLMGRVPKFIKELFLARLGTRFRKEENLREWDSADKKKTIVNSTKNKTNEGSVNNSPRLLTPEASHGIKMAIIKIGL